MGTFQGRSTRSNYTLLEAAEKEKDTDSDDENYFHDSRFDSDESFAVTGNHEEYSRLTADSSDSVVRDQDTPVSSKIDVQSPVSPQERISTIGEQQIQDHDAEKNLIHNEVPVQQCRESVEGEIVQPHNYEVMGLDKISENSKEIASELLEAPVPEESKDNGKEHKRESIQLQSSKHNNSSLVPNDDRCPQPTSEGKEERQTFPQNTSELEPVIRRNSFKDQVPTPEIDHAAVLREYVQQPSYSKKSFQSKDKTYPGNSETENQVVESGENTRLVELKIVESSDSIYEQAHPGISDIDPQKSLTTSDIPHLTDDSDVVFIDAGSPSLSRTKLYDESLSASNEEVVHSHKEGEGDVFGAPDRQTVEPPPVPQTSEIDSECKKSQSGKEDVVPRRRHNSTNSFRDLPIRSPTPPRRRPQKSPRTPKLREKTRQRHSSLALTSDEETHELLTNGTRSASPTSKMGDFRFFSFSLKKEKSKSATSLGSKRSKEKVKLTSVKLSLEDPGVVNPKPVPSQVEEGHIENPGKRVGVRSMMIDGTIKRNFIVIHPSDDSDTIGLAPKSPQITQKELSVSTPEALSSVKTRLAAPTKEKLEATTKISSQGGLKEELSDIPENIRNDSRASLRGSLNFSQISRSLRLKQNKKHWEHVSLKSSHSLSSEPVCPSPSSPQILYKFPLSLSRVECDSPSVLAQKVDHTEDSRTVSKFCVVM